MISGSGAQKDRASATLALTITCALGQQHPVGAASEPQTRALKQQDATQDDSFCNILRTRNLVAGAAVIAEREGTDGRGSLNAESTRR